MIKMISKSLNRFYLAFLQINDASNTCVLTATIQYILATKRFDVPLANP